MRQIKFRVWDMMLKQMFQWSDVNEGQKVLFDSFNGVDAVALQFTGMSDTRGNEIYEGDIIEDVTNRTYFVEYNEEWAAFVFHRVGKQILKSVEDLRGVVIIGNIYQNPELLSHD